MTSFGWKRKAGDKVNAQKSSAFEAAAAEEEDPDLESGSVDWISLQAPKRIKAIPLEDPTAKAKRLKNEGCILAEADRFWEALQKWDEALQLVPNDENIFEMKAQAYMHLNEVFPALHAAEKVVELAPLWWVGHQTLGRAQLGLGEVTLAARSLCRATHLAPGEEELHSEDLPWVLSLLKQRNQMEPSQETTSKHKDTSQEDPPLLVELDSERPSEPTDAQVQPWSKTIASAKDKGQHGDTGEADKEGGTSAPQCRSLKKLPANYVFMRS